MPTGSLLSPLSMVAGAPRSLLRGYGETNWPKETAFAAPNVLAELEKKGMLEYIKAVQAERILFDIKAIQAQPADVMHAHRPAYH